MFKNAKENDRAWDMLRGWGTIISVNPDEKYPIHFVADVDSFSTSTFDGKRDVCDKNPTLFWNELKYEAPRKYYNFRKFIKKNLKVKPFIPQKQNYYLYWNGTLDEVDIDFNISWECFQPYFDKDSIKYVADTLNKNGITKKEFQKIIKELYM